MKKGLLHRTKLSLTLMALAVSGACCQVSAEEEQSRVLRAESERIMDKARELKQEGRLDESEEVASQAKKLRLKADAIEGRKREISEKKDPAPRIPKGDHLRQMRNDLEKLHRQGRHPEAAEMERHLRKLRGLHVPDQPPHSMRPMVERGGEAHRKLRHLHAAIENLRAAGMHEPARDLAEAAENMERELRQMVRERGPEGMRPPEPPRPPHAENRPASIEEVEQLRREVRHLQEQVERLTRERR